MKQVFLFLMCSVVFMALNAHESNTVTCDCDHHQCELTAAPQADIDLNVNTDDEQNRKSGYCTCGGKLKFSAKAIATVKDCTLCKGTGLYYGQSHAELFTTVSDTAFYRTTCRASSLAPGMFFLKKPAFILCIGY